MNRWIAGVVVLLFGSFSMLIRAQDYQEDASVEKPLPQVGLGAPEAISPPSRGPACPTASEQGSNSCSYRQPAFLPQAGNISVGAPGDAPKCATCCDQGCDYPAGCAWISAEYLLWWVKGDRLPPLLTTSPAGTPLADAGVLGKPGTSVLFGDDRVNDGARSGGRFVLGAWLNESYTTGVEGSIFFLGQEDIEFDAASSGIPILARPFFNIQTGANDSLKVAYPGLVSGSFHARETSELWGTDIYLRQNICCGCCYRVDLLGGYRFASLRENLNISEIEVGANPASPLFGVPIIINEGFGTQNNFHGAEFGVIAECSHGRAFFRFLGKLALGGTCRTVNINGNTRVEGFAPESGGFLALPSNIGRYHSSEFSVMPEIGLTVGLELTEHVRVMMGYSFLYWTNVARPGEQIDLAINTSQPPLGSGLTGLPRPAFFARDSDIWAQGLSFGVEFRY